MSLLSGIPIIGDIIGNVLDRFTTNKTESARQQTDLNREEIKGAGQSKLRLWRGFLGWVLAIVFAWEIIGRTILVTYFPHILLPDSMLEEVMRLLLAMLGLGF